MGFTFVAARAFAGYPFGNCCPWGIDESVTLLASQVATEAYRQFLGPDFHRLHWRAFSRHTTNASVERMPEQEKVCYPPRQLPVSDMR